MTPLTRTYLVVIERTGYAHYEIEAKDEEEAEALAWEQYSDADADNCVSNDINEITDITESQDTTDEVKE
jgi:hypothetical protein